MIRNPNAFIFGGVALGLISVLLTQDNSCGGVLEGILNGSSITGTGHGYLTAYNSDGLQTRWLLAIAVLAICWGMYRRQNSN